MNKRNIEHNLLLLEIAIAGQRTEELSDMARDVFIMLNSNCCILSNLSFWMDICEEKILDFLLVVLETMPVIEEHYLELWDAMELDEKVAFILGNDEPQVLNCSCTNFKFS
jgi:hypothetical protein